MGLCLLAVGGLITAGQAEAITGSYCYAVDGAEQHPHYLTLINRLDFNPATNETRIGPTQTLKSEALAIHPTTHALWSASSNMSTKVGYIGTFNVTTAQFTPLPNPIGTAHGARGDEPLYDISGMAFDLSTGTLYAVHVIWTSVMPLPDLLFQVNQQTGTFIPNAFGPGTDYVLLNPLPAYPDLENFDDMAIDPTDGQMYAVVNGNRTGDRLVKINKLTGAVTDIGALGVDKMAGLSFDPTGQLWGTAGGSVSIPNKLYQIDKHTAHISNPRTIDDDENYEALTCMVPLGSGSPPTATPTMTQPPVPTQNPSLNRHVYLPIILR